VIAAGYEADAFLAQPVTALHSTFALVSEPLTAVPGWPAHRSFIWETAEPYIYLRTTFDGTSCWSASMSPFVIRSPVISWWEPRRPRSCAD